MPTSPCKRGRANSNRAQANKRAISELQEDVAKVRIPPDATEVLIHIQGSSALLWQHLLGFGDGEGMNSLNPNTVPWRAWILQVGTVAEVE